MCLQPSGSVFNRPQACETRTMAGEACGEPDRALHGGLEWQCETYVAPCEALATEDAGAGNRPHEPSEQDQRDLEALGTDICIDCNIRKRIRCLLCMGC